MFLSQILIVTLLGENSGFCKENLVLVQVHWSKQLFIRKQGKKKTEKTVIFYYVQTIQQHKIICSVSAPFTPGLLGNLVETYKQKPYWRTLVLISVPAGLVIKLVHAKAHGPGKYESTVDWRIFKSSVCDASPSRAICSFTLRLVFE